MGGEVVVGSDGVVPEKPLGPVFPGFCGKKFHIPDYSRLFPPSQRDPQTPGILFQAGISPWMRRICVAEEFLGMSEPFLGIIQGEIPAKFPAGMTEETRPCGKLKSHIPALGMDGKSWERSLWNFPTLSQLHLDQDGKILIIPRGSQL